MKFSRNFAKDRLQPISPFANDFYKFSSDHNMSLNPKKCKEMLVNFMHNHNFVFSPIILGNDVVDRAP